MRHITIVIDYLQPHHASVSIQVSERYCRRRRRYVHISRAALSRCRRRRLFLVLGQTCSQGEDRFTPTKTRRATVHRAHCFRSSICPSCRCCTAHRHVLIPALKHYLSSRRRPRAHLEQHLVHRHWRRCRAPRKEGPRCEEGRTGGLCGSRAPRGC